MSDAGTVIQSCTSFATTFAVFLTVNEITTRVFGYVEAGVALPVILSFALEPFGIVTRTVALAVLFFRFGSVWGPGVSVAVLTNVEPARSLPTVATIRISKLALGIISPALQVTFLPVKVQPSNALDVALATVRPSGSSSTTTAPVELAGPALATPIV